MSEVVGGSAWSLGWKLALQPLILYVNSMQVHRTEAIVSEDGVLTLHGVPFRRGDSVEVIVSAIHATKSACLYALRGKPVSLIAPTEPVAESDWEAAG